VPSASIAPVSVHVGPVAQCITPVWQAFVGVQLALSVHDTHAPAEQTELAPHGVPSLAFVLDATHVAPPSTHCT
jgi:hypothetical protein